MYTIYNNEIKITQNLKGGSTLTGLDEDPDYKKLFEPYLGSQIHSTKFLFDDKGDLRNKSLKHLIPLKGFAIDYKSFDNNMFEAIRDDIIKLYKVFFDRNNVDFSVPNSYRIFKDQITPGTAGVINDFSLIKPENINRADPKIDEKKNIDIFNKNILRYAMSWAKEIELYDVKSNKLLKYEEFLKKMFQDPTKPPKSGGIPKNFFELITENGSILSKKNKDLFKAVILGIEALLKVYPAVGDECAKMYPKIVTEHNLSHWQGFGGAYDNLKYSLEGGVLSTLIRVPNLSAHFKGQLNVIEARLKNSNKTLSVISKTKIQNVIDQLKKHEDYLKETFNLLRNSHLIDENKIDVVKHKSQLEKAKMSLRKHDRYRSFLTDIIKTIRDAENSMSDKPYFS